jgi:hypothetical protein
MIVLRAALSKSAYGHASSLKRSLKMSPKQATYVITSMIINLLGSYLRMTKTPNGTVGHGDQKRPEDLGSTQ